MINTIHNIDRHKSILLIGQCNTKRYINNLVKPESIDECYKVFGDCNMSSAFSVLFKSDIQDIYIYNIESKHDFLKASDDVGQYDFTYIIPIDIYVSDYFLNPLHNELKTYYIQYMLNSIYSKKSNVRTKILATDKKAELYQDIDSYLNDMANIRNNFIKNKAVSSSANNMIFVLNNLNETNLGSIYLAIALLTNDINVYPTCNSSFPKAVFSIDYTDKVLDMVYFKNHADGSITIENLLNLDTETCAIKIEFISRIVNYVVREIDFHEFCGVFYTEYIKVKIQKKAEEFLNSLIGYVITDYIVEEVYCIDNHNGTVDAYVPMQIQPINCTEKIKLRVKINE